MISGGYRCPLYDDDAAVTTTDPGSDQSTHQLDDVIRSGWAALDRDPGPWRRDLCRRATRSTERGNPGRPGAAGAGRCGRITSIVRLFWSMWVGYEPSVHSCSVR